MITEFLIEWWEVIVIGLLLLNTIIQKIEKIKGNSDILTGIWKLLVWIKSLAGQMITVLFSTKPGKLPMLFIAFMLVSSLVFASSIVTFEWDANTETDLAGYRIYQSTVSGIYTYGPTSPNLIVTIPAGTEEATVEIGDGTYFWVATAFDTEGLESGSSNEITATLNGPPGCIKTFRFKN